MIAVAMALLTMPGQPICAAPDVIMYAIACKSAEFRAAERQLQNAWTDSELARLTQMRGPIDKNKQGYIKVLSGSQSSWEGYREYQCGVEGIVAPPGGVDEVKVISCYMRLTRQRMGELQTYMPK